MLCSVLTTMRWLVRKIKQNTCYVYNRLYIMVLSERISANHLIFQNGVLVLWEQLPLDGTARLCFFVRVPEDIV